MPKFLVTMQFELVKYGYQDAVIEADNAILAMRIAENDSGAIQWSGERYPHEGSIDSSTVRIIDAHPEPEADHADVV